MLKVEEKINTWTILEFGKYAGKTLPQILFNDPDWFFWAYSNAVFQDRGNLASEADEIYKKSRSIRVRQTGDEKTLVKYFIHPITKSFSHF